MSKAGIIGGQCQGVWLAFKEDLITGLIRFYRNGAASGISVCRFCRRRNIASRHLHSLQTRCQSSWLNWDNQTSAEHPDGIYHPYATSTIMRSTRLDWGHACNCHRLKEEVSKSLAIQRLLQHDYQDLHQSKVQHPDLADKEKFWSRRAIRVLIFARVLRMQELYNRRTSCFILEQVGILLTRAPCTVL